jgi:hypothetical protein
LTCIGLVWHEIKLFQVDCATGEENTAEELSEDIDKYQTGDKRSQQEMGTVMVFLCSFWSQQFAKKKQLVMFSASK